MLLKWLPSPGDGDSAQAVQEKIDQLEASLQALKQFPALLESVQSTLDAQKAILAEMGQCGSDGPNSYRLLDSDANVHAHALLVDRDGEQRVVLCGDLADSLAVRAALMRAIGPVVPDTIDDVWRQLGFGVENEGEFEYTRANKRPAEETEEPAAKRARAPPTKAPTGTTWDLIIELANRDAVESTDNESDANLIIALKKVTGKTKRLTPEAKQEIVRMWNDDYMRLYEQTKSVVATPPRTYRVSVYDGDRRIYREVPEWQLNELRRSLRTLSVENLRQFLPKDREISTETMDEISYLLVNNNLSTGDLVEGLENLDEDNILLRLLIKREQKTSSMECSACKKPAEKRCARCSSAVYCSVGCQSADWENHRGVCR
jgi:MYND finger